MKPYLAIFSTVSLGKVSVSSTSCARGFTSFSANSLNSCLAISCSLDNVKSMMLILHCYLYLVVIIMMSGLKTPTLMPTNCLYFTVHPQESWCGLHCIHRSPCRSSHQGCRREPSYGSEDMHDTCCRRSRCTEHP